MGKRVYKKRKGKKVTTRALLDKIVTKAHTTDRESLYREGFPPEHD